jgi:hypothetical protein
VDVRNHTRAKHVAAPYKDTTGRNLYVVILKYTFVVKPQGKVELDGVTGAAPRLVDEYHGKDPSTSSIKRPSQLFDFKPGTDLLLLGHASPPPSGTATHVDVSLRWGHLAKTVRAHGLRAWRAGTFGGLAPGPARPIRDPIPLIYEVAWGGIDWTDPARPLGETRNYVGRGVAADPKKLIDQPAAQLEYPDRPLGGRDNVPASFGAIHRHWQPRASFAGTYDQAWMDNKMPLLPDDFDPRFHVSVPPDQWSPAPLRGDEPVEIGGATPEGIWRFQLPRLAPGFSSFVEGRRAEHRTHLDTILVDADARTVELTWRAAIPIPRKYQMLERVLVFEKRVV